MVERTELAHVILQWNIYIEMYIAEKVGSQINLVPIIETKFMTQYFYNSVKFI